MKRTDIKDRKRNILEFTDSHAREEELQENQSLAHADVETTDALLEEARTELRDLRSTPNGPGGYRGLYGRLITLAVVVGSTDLAAQFALNAGAFPNFSPAVVLGLSGFIASVIAGFTNGLFVVKVFDPRRPFRAVRIAKNAAVISGTMAAVAGLIVLGARFIPASEFERLSALVFGSLVVTSESLPVTAGAVFFIASILNRPRQLQMQIARLKQDADRTNEFLRWLEAQSRTRVTEGKRGGPAAFNEPAKPETDRRRSPEVVS